jgi:hypothetical protein
MQAARQFGMTSLGHLVGAGDPALAECDVAREAIKRC